MDIILEEYFREYIVIAIIHTTWRIWTNKNFYLTDKNYNANKVKITTLLFWTFRLGYIPFMLRIATFSQVIWWVVSVEIIRFILIAITIEFFIRKSNKK